MFEFGSNKGPEVHNIILRQHSAWIGSALQSSMAKNVVICVCLIPTMIIRDPQLPRFSGRLYKYEMENQENETLENARLNLPIYVSLQNKSAGLR